MENCTEQNERRIKQWKYLNHGAHCKRDERKSNIGKTQSNQLPINVLLLIQLYNTSLCYSQRHIIYCSLANRTNASGLCGYAHIFDPDVEIVSPENYWIIFHLNKSLGMGQKTLIRIFDINLIILLNYFCNEKDFGWLLMTLNPANFVSISKLFTFYMSN